MTESGEEERSVPSCVVGSAEEPDPVDIGSGGVDDGAERRRRSRRPSGRHRLWPGTGGTSGEDGVAAAVGLPVAAAPPSRSV